jgi:hypothetical protein
MSDHDPREQEAQSGGAEKPTDHDESESDVVKTLKAIVGSYNAAQTKQSAQDDKHLWWNRATFWAVFVYSIITFGIFVAGIKSVTQARRSADAATKQASLAIDSERARFWPTGFVLKKTNDTDTNPTVDYGFTNMGRTPGLITEVLGECTVVNSTDMLPTISNDPSKIQKMGTAVGAGVAMTTESKPGLSPCEFDSPVPIGVYSMASTMHIFFIGFLRFRDVYGET